MREGPHPHVAGVDDFSDAGATAERDPVGGFPLLRGVVAGEALQGLGPTGLVTLGLHKVCKDGAGKERVSTQQCVPAARQAGFARSEASRELRGRAVMREGGE